jgi:hypothetical protein
MVWKLTSDIAAEDSARGDLTAKMASGFVLSVCVDGALWNCLEGFGALWRVLAGETE